jgi:hypothetical protein
VLVHVAVCMKMGSSAGKGFELLCTVKMIVFCVLAAWLERDVRDQSKQPNHSGLA